ncbi:MAG: fibrobacter succinogenes major paralogous domain-containing protein [Bacteroidetes bacterium]|nr:fibrobacter succinogenes major paralogous domain-containing protein [Bacteroidota bacterium]
MKKVIVLQIVFLLCGFCIVQAQNTDTTDVGVVINGVKWATRNVDEFGTFAKNPYDAGKFYQWNRKKAWNGAAKELEDWRYFPREYLCESSEWEKDNDPCPKGWRVPTVKQMYHLLGNTDNMWISDYNGSGVAGRVFTDGSQELFFPAAGRCAFFDNGSEYKVGKEGEYRSSTSAPDNSGEYYSYVYYLSFSTYIGVYRNSFGDGNSVRCVAE